MRGDIPPSRGKWMTGAEATEEVMAKQVAICLSSGMTPPKAAKELGISRQKVVSISNTDKCKRTMLELSDAAVASAKSVIKSQTAGMAELVIATLKHHLKTNNHNAVPIALKVLGFEQDEPNKGPATFTVILPSTTPIADITPQYSEVPEPNETS